MNYIGKFVTTFRDLYNDVNPATLSGAIDVVVVEQEDGTYACSPFHVRFGKRGVFNRREKIVDITINGEPVDLHMKLGETGEAFFVSEESENTEDVLAHLATSPLPSKEVMELPSSTSNLPSTPPPSLATSAPNLSHISEAPTSSVPSVNSAEALRTTREDSESPEERARHESGNSDEIREQSPENRKTKTKSRRKRRTKVRKAKEEDDIFKMDMTDEDSREGTPEPDSIGGEPKKTSSLPQLVDVAEEPSEESLNTIKNPPRRLSISKSFNSLQSLHKDLHVHFASPLGSRTPSEHVNLEAQSAKSEGQLTPPKPGMDDNLASGFMSDSEVDNFKKSETRKAKEENVNNVTWQWGQLPETSPSKTAETATTPIAVSLENITEEPVPSPGRVEEQRRSGYLSGIFSYIRRPRPASSATPMATTAKPVSTPKNDDAEDGRYLSDLVAETLSRSQKDRYLALDNLDLQHSQPNENRVVEPGNEPLHPVESSSAIQPASMESTEAALKLPSMVEVGGTKIELVPLSAQERESRVESLSQDAKSSSAYSSMTGSPPLSDTESERSDGTKPSAGSGGTVYRKTLRLTSDQIKTLPLQMGLNEAEFCIVTKYQGSATCKCNIFLWRFDDKVVISDIDGTITKSDVLGHILPIIGSTWAQAGVAGLYNRIHQNGYKFLYLSSRAIGQANFTRDHLRSIMQENVTLPDGPLLLSPKSLFLAFHQEVIVKRPEEFKIACLKDIRALYPPDRNPFFAAYGNKTTDLLSYRAVGVSVHRIFTINYQGQLKQEVLRQAQSSYTQQTSLVDMLFPPLRVLPGTDLLMSELEHADDFGSFTFWRAPIPDLDAAHIVIPPPPEPEPVASKAKKSVKEKSTPSTNVSPAKADKATTAKK